MPFFKKKKILFLFLVHDQNCIPQFGSVIRAFKKKWGFTPIIGIVNSGIEKQYEAPIYHNLEKALITHFGGGNPNP